MTSDQRVGGSTPPGRAFLGGLLKFLQQLSIYTKVVLVLLFSTLSFVFFQYVSREYYSGQLGFIFLFSALIVLFEGFHFSLFVKILIALFLGVAIPFLDVIPHADLVVMRPVGSKIFMNFLTMALVPLVYSSILTGVVSLGDLSKLNRIGARTLTYYIVTTAIAITIGLLVANVVQPGNHIDPQVKEQFLGKFEEVAQKKVSQATKNKKTLFETVQSVFPKNILSEAGDERPNMLSLIFFAIVSGLALLKIDQKLAAPVIAFFMGITEMTIQLVIMAMRLAPYGVFAIIGSTIASTQSFDLLVALVPFSIAVIVGLFLHVTLINTVSLKLLSKKKNVLKIFASMKEVILTAFSTSSSGATMPLTLKTVKKDLGVGPDVAGFVIPLGATINMDGTALFQGVSALFLANIYGIHLTLGDQLTVIGMAVLASIGTAAVPGVGVVILTMILVSVNIPPEGILFILPVNNLLDMLRTAVNVIGDMVCAVYIDHVEKSRTS
ncbi:MAG: dicarboxylate/amino acid:cation symporter [Bdellovibrio sp.]|nr:MAG: dicarboxylate/amino acid:cation symporter [Bdellovibrio sp.]